MSTCPDCGGMMLADGSSLELCSKLTCPSYRSSTLTDLERMEAIAVDLAPLKAKPKPVVGHAEPSKVKVKTAADWMQEILAKAKIMGWQGNLTSGARTPDPYVPAQGLWQIMPETKATFSVIERDPYALDFDEIQSQIRRDWGLYTSTRSYAHTILTGITTDAVYTTPPAPEPPPAGRRAQPRRDHGKSGRRR
jgi:hypothetical protein